jgi:hypothetical protein
MSPQQQKEIPMSPIPGGYAASVEAAKVNLEAAKAALSRDVAQGIADAKWASILRDKFDVLALVEHISEAARSKDWLAKLYASADRARAQQPQRGRPVKSTTSTSKTSVGQAAGASGGAATVPAST